MLICINITSERLIFNMINKVLQMYIGLVFIFYAMIYIIYY